MKRAQITSLAVVVAMGVLVPVTVTTGSASATIPNCYTTDFPVYSGSNTLWLDQQTCVRSTPTGYKAEMRVYRKGNAAASDRVKVTYRVELRRCSNGELLSANPRTSNGFNTAGGSSWLFYASTGSVPGNVYGVSYVQNAYITFTDSSGIRRAHAGPYYTSVLSVPAVCS